MSSLNQQIKSIKMNRNRFSGFLVAISLFLAKNTSAQNNGYVQDEVIKVSGITSDSQIYVLNTSEKETKRTYVDGLGRAIQSIALKTSPLQNDLIQPLAYDNLGRQVRSYLPYAGKSTDIAGSYRPNAISTDQPAFYNNASQHTVANDSAPYVQQVLENSPLQRLLQAGNVGAGFQPIGAQHYKTLSHRSNNASDGNILIWGPDGIYSSGSYYSVNNLAVTSGKDEDNIETLSFTDLSGNLILKRQVKSGGNLDTYYIYNAAGMIKYVIPPKAMTTMIASGDYSLTQTGVNKLIFQYEYNSRGQLIEKSVPGKGKTSIVYDPLNRPVLIQEANMIAGNKWSYIKYDALGRSVSEGVYINATNTSRTLMQTYVTSGTIATNYNSNWYESRATDSSTGYFTNVVFPTTNITPLSYSYFDDYDLDNNGTANYSYAVQTLPNEATPTTAPVKDAPTMISNRTVGSGLSNIWLLKVMFYDKKGQPIQTQSNNQLNYSAGVVTDYVTVVPDFTGVPQVNKVSKKSAISTTHTVQTNFIYDHVSRVKSVSQQYNSGALVQIAAYHYNELGQLIRKDLKPNFSSATQNLTLDATNSLDSGGTLNVVASSSITLSAGFYAASGSIFNAVITANSLQSVDFRYNIRGQLLSINNSKLSNDGGINNADDNDVFGMQFLYDKTDNNLSSTPNFNGKLSAVRWMAKNSSGISSYERAYSYGYDDADRYSGATYAERTAGSTAAFIVTNGWNESGVTYDTNGNILTMVRNSSTPGAGTSTEIDNLQYTYDPANPNQLLKVTDGTTSSHTGAGFMNLTGSTGNYGYNANSGNLTADPYKGITSITYNDLNRTDRISLSATQYIDYTYSADGTLLRKQSYKSGVSTQITDYIEGFVYNNASGTGVLAYFPMPEGKIRNDGGVLKQEFVITDQQGNARVSFEDNGSGVAVVRQENSYYGFGLIMPNSAVGTLGDSNKRLYNGGSEWQNDYGNLPDYYQTYYRNYDAAIGRFISVDPKADGAESMSVYHYAGNIPIMANDPMGDLYRLTEAFQSNPDAGGGNNWGRHSGRSEFDVFGAGGSKTYDRGGGSGITGFTGETYGDAQFWSDLFHDTPHNTTFSGGQLRQKFQEWNAGPFGLSGVMLAEVSVTGRGDILQAVQGRYNEYWANKRGGSVGEPGFAESLIPIWGSGRSAVDNYQNGNYWTAAGYTALAVSDVFLVKSIGTAVGKGAWKLGSHSWSATSKWMTKNGYTGVKHHWAISQKFAKQHGLEAIANQPWNIKLFVNQATHMTLGHGQTYKGVQGAGALGQAWYGTPTWFKAFTIGTGGDLVK